MNASSAAVEEGWRVAFIASCAVAGISVSGVGEADTARFLVFDFDDLVGFGSDVFGFLATGCCGSGEDFESDSDDEESDEDIGSEVLGKPR